MVLVLTSVKAVVLAPLGLQRIGEASMRKLFRCYEDHSGYSENSVTHRDEVQVREPDPAALDSHVQSMGRDRWEANNKAAQARGHR